MSLFFVIPSYLNFFPPSLLRGLSDNAGWRVEDNTENSLNNYNQIMLLKGILDVS